MFNRKDQETHERTFLKPYACFSDSARRSISIESDELRTEFQRDRDRIIHSKAFRRLEYKTQVYLTQKGDHLRTRLTHSLEVAQLGRTVANQLGLNTDLVEAIALGHDVGHTPFGHIGERVLGRLLCEDGVHCFKHNVQSVRILRELEKKYTYNGLNLTYPVLEGILKHTKLPMPLPDYCSDLYPNKKYSVTLEGQIVAVCDEIAQMTHDMDDYLRYKIVSQDNFVNHELFSKIFEFYHKEKSKNLKSILADINEDNIKKEIIIRHLVDYLVTSLVIQSENAIKDLNLKAYEIDKVYIDFDNTTNTLVKSFHENLNQLILDDYKIQEMDRRGAYIIETLYCHYKKYPNKLESESTKAKFKKDGIVVIGDYISGMTDRYALERYNAIIDVDLQ